MENKKKQGTIILICILAGAGLIGAIVIAGAFLLQKNPLAAGLAGLAEEVNAWEAELGENFWTDAVNQIGNGNMQAEYSFNIGGIPTLQNMTVGVDGKIKRDMEQQLFETDLRVSVTNAAIAEASVSGTENTIYLQVPSIWDGSVIFKPENVNGQWNNSAARKQLQLLTGQELGIDQRIDMKMLESFSVEPFSAAGFFREHAEELKNLYKNMETVKVEKAKKEGMLSEEQAESLTGYVLEDAEGNAIETTCYLVILPEKELGDILKNVTGDIKLAVYLDQEKRIVRISTLPGGGWVTDSGERELALNLTGEAATIDRLELTISGVLDADKLGLEELGYISGKVEAEADYIIVKEPDEKGTYDIECEMFLAGQNDTLEFSAKGSIQGERLETGEKLSLNAENLTVRSQDAVLCRCSGNILYEPLEGNIKMPSGKEYRIGEMGEIETMLFLAGCAENVYKNYSGYLKMLR